MGLCPLANTCDNFRKNSYECKIGESKRYEYCGEYKAHIRSVNRYNKDLSNADRSGHWGTGRAQSEQPKTKLVPVCPFINKCNPSKQKMQEYCASPNFAGSAYCGAYGKYSEEKNSNSSDCIVSTACTSAMNFPDNCEELITLRKFRDEYVKTLDDGQVLIEDYYEIAPGIVTWINQQPDKDETYARLYSDLVQGTIALFNAGKKAEALQHYRSIVEELKSVR